jgi:hypothetical protein
VTKYRSPVIETEPAISDETVPWARILHWAAWALATCFVLAGILFVLVESGVIEGPGAPPGIPNDYPTRLGYFLADQRVIFPYETAAAVLFSLGFIALAGIGVGLRGVAGPRDPMGTITAGCFGFAAGIGVISQLAYVGAKRVAIDPAVCECKYAPEQTISQDRALEMIGGASDWLLAGALLLAALGMLTIPSLVSRSRSLSRLWAQVSQVLGIVLLIGVLALLFEVDIVFQLIAAVGSVILLPAWALWLDRQVTVEAAP